MVYSIKDSKTNSSCWGYVTIEDKAAPDAHCLDRTISCFEVNQLNNILADITDNCADKANAIIEKLTFEDYGCGDRRGLGVVHRTIRTWDSWGNAATCSDNLTVKKDSLENVVCGDLIPLDCNTSLTL